MPLITGARIGPYEITGTMGAGGMGEVYRARDTQLDREVALKVLPELFVSDPDRVARFQREAKTLAALNHPNIGGIYGLEEENGVTALVMELVEGEDLAQRIIHGPIPLDDALPVARQIAEALEAAHEQGIIHRDLKPANIKLRPDGTVKVLDFGLAKVLGAESGISAAGDVSRSPTLTTPAMMTGVGMILGTAAYMAPEQAKGRAADKQSDIWAFGCVLYEMLTGTRAFGGEDISDTLANVLKGEPDWAALPTAIPGAVRTLLRRCLTKDRKRRLDSAADARLEIDDALTSPGPEDSIHAAPAPRLPPWRRAMPVVAAMLAALAAGYAAWTLKPAAPRLVTRFVYSLTEIGEGASNPNFHQVALSPDGTRLAYGGNSGLYLRAFDSLDAEPIAGLPGAGPTRTPFFSPDGQWVGFWHDGKLKKVSVSGGAPVTLCVVAAPPFGATWAADGTVLFGQGPEGIWRVSGDGGTPEQIITVKAGQRAHGPQLLPDGRTVLFTLAQTGDWAEAQLVAHSLDNGARQTLLTGGTDGRYLPTGHIVYMLRGTMLAVPVDVASLRLRGGPVPTVEGMWEGSGIGAAQFAVSAQGTLAYVPPPATFTAARRELVWVDRQGREEAIAAPPRPYVYPRLAPDGARLVLDVAADNRDIWIWDFARGTLTRLTDDPSLDRGPIWTPDGQRIIFSSNRAGVANLFWQAANGTGMAERLTNSNNVYAHTISPDGTRLVVRQTDRGAAPDLMMFDLGNRRRIPSPSSGVTDLTPLVKTPFGEFNAEISSDGRWLAYQSNSSGSFEVYVRPFPDVGGGQWLVSTAGGTEPLWSRDGRELFYRAPSGGVMRVGLTPGSTWTADTPAELIAASPYAVGARGDFNEFPYRTYDVSLDGLRFLMIKNSEGPPQTSASPRIIVVQNWFDELKRRVPAK